MQLGAHVLRNTVFLAPMAGITDRPFRALARRFGAGLAVSEMVSAKPELRHSRKSLLRVEHAGEPGSEVWRLHRHREPTVRHRLAGRCIEEMGVDHAVFERPGEHTVAAHLREFGPSIGPAALGRLRQGDQQGGLGNREVARLLAEIGEGGRAHALQIAAHRRKREIDRQDLAFGIAPFELQRARRLDRLGEQAALRGRLQTGIDQAGSLHGKRRGAGHDAAAADPLLGGAEYRERIAGDLASFTEPAAATSLLVEINHRKADPSAAAQGPVTLTR